MYGYMYVWHCTNKKHTCNTAGDEADDGTNNKIWVQVINVQIFSVKNPKNILGTKINVNGLEKVQQWKLEIHTKAYGLGWWDTYPGSVGLSLSHIQIFSNKFIQMMEIFLPKFNHVFRRYTFGYKFLSGYWCSGRSNETR